MASFTRHRSLRDDLTRIGATTFDQVVDDLLSTKYTAERFPRHTSGERRKLARSEVADAVARGIAAGWLVEERDVRGRGENPRARLLFDAGVEAEPTAAHHEALYRCWRRSGRREMTVIYAKERAPRYARRFAPLGPDRITAELVASSIYFGLPAESRETWRSQEEAYGLAPRHNSILRDLTPVVTGLVAASCRAPGITSVFVPVVAHGIAADRLPEHGAEFVAFFRWAMGIYSEITDFPLQIWQPDPESILH